MTALRPSPAHSMAPAKSKTFPNVSRSPPTPPKSTDGMSLSMMLDEDETSVKVPPGAPVLISTPASNRLLHVFLQAHQHRLSDDKEVSIDGHNLSIPQVTAVARFNNPVRLSNKSELREKVENSRNVIDDKLSQGVSIYGISTGFGGSADTRTKEYGALGLALLQHQHIGVLPSVIKITDNNESEQKRPLPFLDPLNSLSMPPSWVRAAILVRINSLVRGHSAVRWTLVESMVNLLQKNIIPVVPLRSSISASGDLSPLSYVAGTVMGEKNIFVYTDPFSSASIVSAEVALREAGLSPLLLKPKEHLGILNGTAFSAGLAALAVDDAVHLALLANVCTAMGTEALLGTPHSHASFIHEICRPHPGQIESAKLILNLLSGSKFAAAKDDEVYVDEDIGKLRQDRYPLRTAPQFLGPQMEDILSAWETVTLECNSTTDNPLVDGETGKIYHAGNFQAMSVSNAMEKTRLALHHIGKILFAQSTELLNPSFNRGLPPSVAATDPSLNFHAKGLDIATASYVGELGWLASPVTTHIQSAEMHNQAVNSLALISARATIQALDVLRLLMATYLYILCQALDLRCMQSEFRQLTNDIIEEELSELFGSKAETSSGKILLNDVRTAFHNAVDANTTYDAELRMRMAAQTTGTPLLNFLSSDPNLFSSITISSVTAFQRKLAVKTSEMLQDLRQQYLTGAKGQTPASPWLGRTRAVYEFIRMDLGVKMHGLDNLEKFSRGLDVDSTIGQNVSVIFEALTDGKLQSIVASLF